MYNFRAARHIWRTGVRARPSGHIAQRFYAAEPPPTLPPSSPPNPNSPPKEPSRVGAFYKTFSYPILKAFLIALLTYQLTYYAWLKLETIEEAHDKQVEISELQRQLREAVVRQKEAVKDKVTQAVDEVAEVKDIAVESVKEGVDEAKKTTTAVGRVASGGWWP